MHTVLAAVCLAASAASALAPPGVAIDPGSSPPSARGRVTAVAEITDPLALLVQLRGVRFEWDAAHGGGRDTGMIAGEVAAAVPEAVGFAADGVTPERVDLSRLVPLLVESTKALLDRAETTERTVRSLSARAADQSSESNRLDAFARRRDTELAALTSASGDQTAEIRRLGDALRLADQQLRLQSTQIARLDNEVSRLSAALAGLDPDDITDDLDDLEDDLDALRLFVLKHVRECEHADPG